MHPHRLLILFRRCIYDIQCQLVRFSTLLLGTCNSSLLPCSFRVNTSLCGISEGAAYLGISPPTALVDVDGQREEQDYQQIRTAQFHRESVMHRRRMFA